MKIKVSYLHHCGYRVETKNTVLVFDWIKGVIEPSTKKKLCFITHGHRDHFEPSILNEDFETFIISDDINLEHRNDIVMVHPDQTLEIDGVTIEVLGSTDLGCSYYVEVDGCHLFFGGDLNNWHWSMESTSEEIKEMNDWYLELIQPLKDKQVDILFIDIDPRLEVDYDLGTRQLLELISPKAIFPMHFTSDLDAMKKYYATTQINNLVHVLEDETQFELDW